MRRILDRAMEHGRYRTRTWLRRHMPEILTTLFPKGQKDCGDHEWYRSDGTTARCYHCTAGERSITAGTDLKNLHRLSRPARSS